MKLADGMLIIGFARNQALVLTDKVVAAVKSGAIKRFVVMGGCAKYRYNTLDLEEIGGIPRVLDTG